MLASSNNIGKVAGNVQFTYRMSNVATTNDGGARPSRATMIFFLNRLKMRLNRI